jgi:hypothetical protein
VNSNPKVKKVTATITLETTFESYGTQELDDRALEQIERWILETLEEEENIPLFIRCNSGEITGEKKVSVKMWVK